MPSDEPIEILDTNTPVPTARLRIELPELSDATLRDHLDAAEPD